MAHTPVRTRSYRLSGDCGIQQATYVYLVHTDTVSEKDTQLATYFPRYLLTWRY